MSPSAFTVSRFINPNGTTSWRVDGRIQGPRIRKNFKTRAETGAEKATLEAKAAQTPDRRSHCFIWTSLVAREGNQAAVASP